MELNKQVVNLELSKKLKELGYPQEGLFMWVESYASVEIWGTTNIGQYPSYSMLCVAPTVAELLDKMPSGARVLDWSLDKCDGIYTCWLFRTDNINAEKNGIHMEDGYENPANCLAKMLMWLVENNYVEFRKKQDGK